MNAQSVPQPTLPCEPALREFWNEIAGYVDRAPSGFVAVLDTSRRSIWYCAEDRVPETLPASIVTLLPGSGDKIRSLAAA